MNETTQQILARTDLANYYMQAPFCIVSYQLWNLDAPQKKIM